MDEQIRKGSFLALIPARGGSKGVPHKNIKNLCGFPLIAYTIAVCQMSEVIDRIIVSTDDEKIRETGRNYGAEVPFLRPSEFAGDRSADYGFVNHAIQWLLENEGDVPEFIVHMRPTTPIRERAIVDDALMKMLHFPEYTSLRSAHEAPESPYKWFLKQGNGTFHSIMKDIDNESANTGRNDFPKVYVPDGYVDVLRTEFVIKKECMHGEMMYGFESPYCTEVDTQEEFDYLEYQMQKERPEVYRYLEDCYGG